LTPKHFPYKKIAAEIEKSAYMPSKDILKKALNEKLFFILDSIAAYVCYIDATTLRYKFVNNAFATGYQLPREQILGSHMSEILPEKNYQNAIQYIEAVKKGTPTTYEYYFNVPIGNRWVKVDYVPEFDATGNVDSFIVLGTDITDRKIAEEKLQKSEARYRFIVEAANEGIMILKPDLKISFVNCKLSSMLGYEMEELLGLSFKSLLFEEHLSDLDVQMKERQQGKDALYERYLRKKDGSKHWVIISAKALMDEEGNYTGSFAMLTDIHARKLLEKQLKKAIKKLEVLSNEDGLTKLANRRYFDEALSLEYARLSQNRAKLSFIMIDIDFFKGFNDSYGHLAGDDCLRQVAKVLASSIFRPEDLVARYGGEEFICMLPETSIEDAGMIAEKMRASVENLHICHKDSKASDYVTISLGIATIQCTPSHQVSETIRNADKALYQAKANGRNRIEIYSSSSKE